MAKQLSKSIFMKIIYTIAILICFFSCKNPEESKAKLGEVKIEISGNSKAIPQFEKGLLLLHSFEYEDAREAFQKARDIDPQMAMAYWGEAMSYNHSLWSEQDYEAATAVLDKLDQFNYKAGTTQLEQDMITAVKILYKPKTEKNKRDIAYSEYMEKLYKKYSGNHEVAAFYALSLLGSVPEGRDNELYEKGAMISQGILEKNPNHPGALHYLIHSYDDPNHATLALDAAHAYAKVAPDAGHALHMPSHIFVAMGMWNEVIASNIDSYNASIERMKAKNLDNDARGYHAFHWLEYGYLQKDQREKAKQMVKEMQQFVSEDPSIRARVHLVFLKGTYLVETNDWNNEIASIPVDISDLNISIRSQHHFLDGMRAYIANDRKGLDGIIKLSENDHNRGSFIVTEGAAKLCSNAERGDLTQTDLTQVLVRTHQLKGLLADLDMDLDLAEEHFKKAISLEESLSYSYGPPFIQKPSIELYADWLLEQDRFEEARTNYKLMLKRAPKRKLSVAGLKNTKADVL